jgi:DNA-binding MarR family transcriptional regulator
MDFYARTGKMALGSRLRRLSEQMTEQAAGIYDLYQVDLHPKWFPVFYSLSATEGRSITDIAREIGHTHPSVSQIVREMAKRGYVIEKQVTEDGRKNLVILSPAGRQQWEKLQPQLHDVTAAIEKAMKETHNDLWKAIAEWEHLLEQKTLLQRVREEKKRREGGQVAIVDFQPDYQQAFRQLNEEWITRYFKMEEGDYKALDHPMEYIIDKGGYIFMALYKDEPIGTCALIRMDDGGFELAKMAVSPKAQGLGIGYLLGIACIAKARTVRAPRLYLESNTTLKPAINLYYKLGFRKAAGPPSPYERANIQMELPL